MSVKTSPSSVFASLVSKLQKSPENHALKPAVVNRMPEMKALSKINPMVLFRLAKAFPPNSPKYKQTMMQSAELGCTNAMLAICELLVNSNEPFALKKAGHYLLMIEKSQDSYMKEQSKALLAEYPQLAAAIKTQSKPESYPHAHRFFTVAPERKVREQVEHEVGMVRRPS